MIYGVNFYCLILTLLPSKNKGAYTELNQAKSPLKKFNSLKRA